MSEERELLERAYQYIPLSSVTSQEIRDFLSTPEPTQDEEPVAWLYSKGDVLAGVPVVFTSATIGKDFAFQEPHYDQKPLYLHPAPRPEFVRLSEEEIEWLMDSALSPKEIDERDFYYFARAIEDALEARNTPTTPSLKGVISANSGSLSLQSQCRGDKL